MRLFRYLILCAVVSIYSTFSFAQLDSVWHQGPAMGSVASGVMVTLTLNTFQPESSTKQRIIERNKIEPDFGNMIIKTDESLLPEYHYVEDSNAGSGPSGVNGQTVLLNKFESIPMTNSIPPDPHLAVGPNHVISCVNSRFAVYDKQGNQLANIDADSWIGAVIGQGAFDPQVLYDHYSQRWFMLWDWKSDGIQEAYFIISYTDDSDPFGTWYMYAMDAKVNGTANSGTWGDYPQIGYDEDAIYINSRSFTFPGSYLYNRIRILDKSELYSSNAGTLTWKDIWNIRTPGQGSGGQALDVIHPVYSYTPGSGAYFFWANRGGANFYCVFQILNPLGTLPRIRGKVIPTQFYFQAPNANQLGGGTLIETNGSHIKTQPVLRDNKIFFAHSIGNTTSTSYSSAKYGIYDISTQTITEQAEQGAVGYFYIYPTITVDQSSNIAVTYSRSGDNEYVGAFYTSKQASAPPGLEPSQPIQEGLGNYVVTFGGTRNRWGDYLGICIDPANFQNVFMLSEYARATNQWGTYIAEIRMVPFTGIHTITGPELVDFGNIQVDSTSSNLSVVISNYGEDDLIISDIPNSLNDFHLQTSLSFPITLTSYDSLTLALSFSPAVSGLQNVTYPVTSNDPGFTGISLKGNGYDMYPALDKTFYASSGSANSGNLLSIDQQNGTGTNIGPSGYVDIKDIAINEENGIIYALRSSASSSQILRVNSGAGDAYLLFELDLPEMESIAFNSSNTLYGALKTGEIYTIDLTTGSYTFVTTSAIELLAVAINKNDDSFWITVRNIIGSQKDRIYTVDLMTGDTTRIGRTGLNTTTNSIAFDEMGNLFGVVGSGSLTSDFISISTIDGSANMIGSTGIQGLTGISFGETGVSDVQTNTTELIPSDFNLKQNYPNPFNPSTKIEFAIPVQSDVQLTIYNLLGQKISTLFDGQLQAGNHSFTWNADDISGKKLSSGIYFYELKAEGSNGNNFQNTKKMLLLK